MIPKKDAAITSAIAGTTRDVIEVRMDLGGLPITLLDTAGLRVSEDEVEILGVERAKLRAEAADIRVFLLADGENYEELGVDFKHGDVVAYGKADVSGADGLAVSGLTGVGVEELLNLLSEELSSRASGASSAVRERHRIALLEGISALDSAKTHVNAGAEWSDLAAEDMRQTLRSLDSMIGRVDVENVLDVIFSSFCIGK